MRGQRGNLDTTQSRKREPFACITQHTHTHIHNTPEVATKVLQIYIYIYIHKYMQCMHVQYIEGVYIYAIYLHQWEQINRDDTTYNLLQHTRTPLVRARGIQIVANKARRRQDSRRFI